MQHPDIVVPICLKHTQTATCTPPWYVQHTEYPPAIATYEPLINGEEAFRAVHEAIAQATKSVDIICWGFQPSMYFIRDGKAPSIGELLKTKARQGVQVRMLGWEMPFNAAGFAGEANLPGKGTLRFHDQALQSATTEQYAYDRRWFAECAASDRQAAQRISVGRPVFVSRGFSLHERAEIAHQARYKSLDPGISKRTLMTLTGTATHHQKSVLVDYEMPDKAVGFVMGHNMLDEYWDTDAHSAQNRTEDTKPAPNLGARGREPRQDVSCRISGPILEHLHHNFAQGWRKETGEDLLVSRKAMEVGPRLLCAPGVTRQMAQVLRTQPQEGKRDIEQVYLNAVNNATQFIYIENQYFRWPPLAEAIKKAAADQTRGGRKPGEHDSLHLFVITNATDGGIGAGTLNTQRMLECLGRREIIPEVTKLRLIADANRDYPPRPTPEPRDHVGQKELSEWQADLDRKIKHIKETVLRPDELPGLKVHVCSLVAPDSPGHDWVPVYIHSKLMIVNDVFTTHGSANINTRSMQVDSELNIAHEWMSVTQALRRRLWGLHTAGMGVQDEANSAFESWQEITRRNKELRQKKLRPYAPLVEFFYGEAKLSDLD
ncbi:phosphatidylserine/phosphatidylglycerophosphate/cardiolipin synthase family protein [Pseudomonas sp. FP2309]|uniref:phospholipase D-like domain-containing protein n=1 Tax=Pseudomonas sp. FP2309 TaxID=2954091 RepID=UPI0027335256|nr:phospholipase [Pseudomonas sp. FP2309]WLH68460.1 phospholipase [Pseudomonas sp. FP2309]